MLYLDQWEVSRGKGLVMVWEERKSEAAKEAGGSKSGQPCSPLGRGVFLQETENAI